MDDLIDPAPRLPMTSGERRGLQVCAAVFVGLLLLELFRDWTPRKLSFLFTLAAWPLILVIHELGHALAARMVGWNVSEIVIGFGREWKTFMWGDTKVRLKMSPLEGYVLPSAGDLSSPRLKSAWVYFGGPATGLLLLVLMWALSGGKLFQATDQVWIMALQGIAMSAGMSLFFTLIPMTLSGSASDGLGIIQSFFIPDEHFQYQLMHPVRHRVLHHLILGEYSEALSMLDNAQQQHPGEVDLLELRAMAELLSGDEPGAKATLERAKVLGKTPYRDMARAWAALRNPSPGNSLLALNAARQAVENAPHEMLACCLHGWALLEAGRAREAYGLLMAAYKKASVAEEEGMCLALLVRAAEEAGPGGSDPHIPNDAVARFSEALKRLHVGPIRLSK